jgi:hypothetical protein
VSSEQLPASAIEMSGGKSTSCRLLFGSAGDDFREGLLINVLGLTWAMAGLYA